MNRDKKRLIAIAETVWVVRRSDGRCMRNVGAARALARLFVQIGWRCTPGRLVLEDGEGQGTIYARFRSAPVIGRRHGRIASDAIDPLSGREDAAAVAQLSANVNYNAQLHTTCVATMLEAGHAANALPQTARATINCRILPNERVDDVRTTLRRVLADERISVSQPGQPVSSAPSMIDPRMLAIIEKTAAELWPGAPVVPVLSIGSTDSRHLRRAGIPTFGHSGLPTDGNGNAHGKDEHVNAKAFFEGGEYLYRLVKRLSGAS